MERKINMCLQIFIYKNCIKVRKTLTVTFTLKHTWQMKFQILKSRDRQEKNIFMLNWSFSHLLGMIWPNRLFSFVILFKVHSKWGSSRIWKWLWSKLLKNFWENKNCTYLLQRLKLPQSSLESLGEKLIFSFLNSTLSL